MSEEYYDAMQATDELIRALKRQQQCDEEGVLCIVSREACDHAAIAIYEQQQRIAKLEQENEALKADLESDPLIENFLMREALQKVLDDSEIGVVPRSHLDRIERLLSGEG